MSETTRTLTFAGVALALLAAAGLADWLPGRFGGPSAEFDEQGQPFFPAFAAAVEADPLAAKVLEIIKYDAETAQVEPFKVQLKDGQWTLPSQHDYPAKAADKIARLAASAAQLRKDAIRSDRPDDHERLGVIDPLDTKTTSLKGRGTRITLRDRPGGETLADFIVGEADPDRPGLRFVRQAGKNRVYAANVDLDLSTDFAGWIEPDLVAIPPADVVRVVYDTRKVDPERETITKGEPIVLDRVKPAPTAGATGGATWGLQGLADGQEVDGAKVDDVIRAVDGLRVVGVRPLPESGGSRALQRSLISKGFYLIQGEGGGVELVSNEGSIRLDTDRGLSYNLQFGEVTFATGESLTSGSGEDQRMAGAELVPPDPSAAAEGSESDPEDRKTESRYVVVTVRFDPDLIPAADPDAGELPEELFAKPADDPDRVAAEKKAKDEAQARAEERERLIAEGEKTVNELNEKLTRWYYVIPGTDFRRVIVDRDDFIKKPGAPAPDAESPPFAPSDPHGGLPGGFELPGLRPPGGN